MSADRAPLAAFDDGSIEAAASAADVSTERVRDLVERHQERVRDLPGVEDIVYEWRSQFHEDPLVDRSPEAYVLVHRPHVWDEFVSAMDLTDQEAAVLLDAHDRQARTLLSADAASDHLASGQPMVLTRP